MLCRCSGSGSSPSLGLSTLEGSKSSDSHPSPNVYTALFQPWSLNKLMPFRQEFLSGFVTETYQTPLKEGFSEAQQLMRPSIENAVMNDIGGDEQRIGAQKTEYSDVTFKHILLPVWLSAYAYGGKTYRFTVNAQTGEVSGERPYSVWKIALAVIAGLGALFLLFMGMDGGGF